ncbi:esterase [Thalassobacillus devorans]|uniref:Esterase n=2 Tax=Thalassobacillus devorans TaxID=279813 RepID=A0ABQ1NP81_9BACI|nr:hotdog fold thioesterase [Thalassobacillus devorans]GGC81208.1 esterase [Thalassobacillus devorans]
MSVMELQFDNTMMEALGMEVKELEKDKVVMTMPVHAATHQPLGFLHGGASVALAESAASIGAFHNINPETHRVFGVEINANHIKSKREGVVTATAVPFHIGRNTMVWEIKITDEAEKLISISRCTIGVVPL